MRKRTGYAVVVGRRREAPGVMEEGRRGVMMSKPQHPCSPMDDSAGRAR